MARASSDFRPDGTPRRWQRIKIEEAGLVGHATWVGDEPPDEQTMEAFRGLLRGVRRMIESEEEA